MTAWINVNNSGTGPTISDNNGETPFTEIYGDRAYNSDSARYHIWQRVAGASEPSAYAFTISTSERWAIIIHVASGVNTSSPWEVTPSATTENLDSTSPFATDSITTSVNYCLGIVAAFSDSATATFDSTPGDSFNSRQNNSGEQLIALADKTMASATTQASVSWGSTDTPNQEVATQAVALKA